MMKESLIERLEGWRNPVEADDWDRGGNKMLDRVISEIRLREAAMTQQPVESPRIQELEIFIEQMYETLKAGKIRDFDTNWRMIEKVMPPNLECMHGKDGA
jgi:hypothetical protein